MEYSSTNYIMAGLVLLAHSPSAQGRWDQLDVHPLVFPPSLRGKYAAVRFINDEPICSSGATIAGQSGMGCRGRPRRWFSRQLSTECETGHLRRGLTEIWKQRGGILGWTCGNMVATPREVASFFRDLLVEKTVIGGDSLRAMEAFKTLNYGWAQGTIRCVVAADPYSGPWLQETPQYLSIL